MDDYNLSSLSESKNEWCIRLVNILTPTIVGGIRSIFNEALELCQQNQEEDQYLLTFQTFLTRIPKWNDRIIREECTRIEENSNCGYLEELISCVHIIQLKALTCIRVGSKQKKVDLEIPKVDQFIHRVYINVARTLYTNVYLFEHDIMPLQIQKNNREFEHIVKEAILNSIRETMPIENILKAYIDVTEELETDIQEEVIIEPIEIDRQANPTETKDTETKDTETKDTETKDTETNDHYTKPTDSSTSTSIVTEVTPENIVIENNRPKINFADRDHTIDTLGNTDTISAPKDDANLQRLEEERFRQEQLEDDDDGNLSGSLQIGDTIDLDITDINDLNQPIHLDPPLIDEIEVLE